MAIILKEESANSVSTPAVGKTTLFVDDSGVMSIKNDAGNVSSFPTIATSNTQVLYTDGSAIGGDNNFTWDKNSFVLTVNGNIDVTRVKTDNLLYANGDPWDLQLPGGSNTQIQFNDDDQFGGSAAFTFNKTTNAVSMTGNLSAGNISATDVSGTTLGGTLTTASQPNVTSVGTLTDLNVTGNASAGNLSTGGALNVTGNAIVGGNLTVNGNITYINVDTLQVEDPVISLGGGPNGDPLTSNDGKDRGLLLNYYTSAPVDAFMGWDNSNAEFVLGSNVSIANDVVTFNTLGNLRLNDIISNNANLGNLVTANFFTGVLTYAAQPNITSVGTLQYVYVGATSSNVDFPNAISITSQDNTGANGPDNIGLLGEAVANSANANITGIGVFGVARANGDTKATGVQGQALVTNTADTGAAVGVRGYSIDTHASGYNIGVLGNAQGSGLGNYAFYVQNGGIASIENATFWDLADDEAVAIAFNSTGKANILAVETTDGAEGVFMEGYLNVTGNITATAGLKTDNLYYANGQPWDLQEAAGSNNEIQFNSNDNFSASANLTFDPATNLLSVVGNVGALNVNAGNLLTANFIAGTLTTASQPNITGVGTLGTLSVTGNIAAGNVLGGNSVTANFLTGTLVTNAQPNITSVGTLTDLTVTGNVTGGNLSTGGLLSVTGNANVGNIGASAGVFTGDISALNANLGNLVEANFVNIANDLAVLGDSNLGNLAIANFVSGTLTTASQPNITSVGTLTDLTVTGNASAGNVDAGNLLTANFVTGTLTTASQPNVTSLGTLTGLDVNGNITAANITANTGVFTGNGSGLSAIAGANVTGQVGNALVAGTVYTNAQPNITSVGTLTSLDVTGNLTAGNADLGNLATANFLTGTLTTAAQPNVTSLGTLTGLDVNGNIVAANITANTGVFTGNGSGLSALAGANVTGTVANATHASTANTVVDAAQPNITSVGTLTSLAVTGNASAGNISTGGTLSVTGNANVGNIGGTGAVFTTLGGTLTTNAQPNITSVGTLTSLDVTGNTTAGNVYANSGTVGASLLTGTLTTASQPNVTSLGTLTGLSVNGNITAANITANTGVFTGNGSGLSALAGANVTGQVGNALVAGTVYTNAQPNITSVGTLTSLTVTGNASAGNISTGGILTVTGNITGGNLDTTGQLSAGNIITAGLANVGSLSVVANASAGNISTGGTLSVTGNANVGNIGATNGVFTNVSGNGSALSAITGANVTGEVGFAAVANSVAGANVTGQVGNALVAGTVYTAAQPNITSVGTLTSLSVTGNASAGNISTGGVLSVTGNANVGNIGATNGVFTNVSGNGSALSALTGANVTGQVGNALVAGTVYTAAQPNITSVGTLTSLSVTGNVAAGNLTTTGILSVTGTGTSSIAGNLDMTSNNISNLATPVNDADAATKAYVDNLVSSGIHYHEPVRVESPVNLNATYNNGASGVGATLTNAGANAALVIDGVSLNVADRVLIYQQTNQTQNGVYVVTTVGDGSTAWVLTRASDADTYSPSDNTGLDEGSYFFVQEGATGAGEAYVCSTVGVITFGTTNITFAQFSSSQVYSAGTGLTLANTTFSVNASQTQITSVGTLTGLNVNGNIVAANITANTGVFTGNGSGLSSLAGANVTGQVGNALVAGTVYTAAQPNITSVGTLSSLNVTGNANAGNIGAAAGVFTSVSGNGAALTALNASNIASGTLAQARLANTGLTLGSTTLTLGGTTTTVAGLTSVTSTTFVGALTGAADTAGTVTTAAQPNITSVGTLTGLGVNGNITAANITANTGVFTGNGSGLSALNASNISSGTINAARVPTLNQNTTGSAATVTTNAQPNITSVGTLSSLTIAANGDISMSGTGSNINGVYLVTANFFSGNGSNLSSIAGANVTGTVASATAATTAGTVTTAAQPNITSVGTLGALTVTNKVTAGQLQGEGGNISNIQGGNVSGTVSSATTAGTVTTAAQPNITSVGTLTSLGVNGNITAANITANTGVFTGNGSGLSALNGSNITTGTIAAARVATLNQNTTGYAATVSSAAQPNITSVGTLTSLAVTGNASAGNISATAGTFTSVSGNGSALSALNGSNITTGTIAAARVATLNQNTTGSAATVTTAAQPNITSVGTLTGLGVNGNITAANITANTGVFTGNGSGLSALNGSNITTGTIAAARVATLNQNTTGYAATVSSAAQPNITSVGTLTSLTVSGNANAGNVGATNFVGSGASLTNLNASNLASGTVPSARLSGTYTITVSGSATTAGTVTTAAQPNITSVGTLTSLTVSGAANVQSTTAATSTTTGALKVAGGIGANGNSYLSNMTVKSNIAYVSPNGANTINSTMLNGGTLAWSGNAGQLFSITDSMSGNIFSVNDVSGIPMITVSDTGTINLAPTGGFVAFGVSTGVSAAGSTQGTATALTRPVTVVSTVSNGANGVIMPTTTAGMRVLIINTSANALNVYPASGGAINSASANAAYSLPAGGKLEFISTSTTQWYTLNATYA